MQGAGRRGLLLDLRLAGPIVTAVTASAVLGAVRSTLFLQSRAGDKALSHPGLHLTEALLTRLTEEEVGAPSGRRGAQGLTVASGKTLGWGGDRKTWGRTLCLEVTTWAGRGGLCVAGPRRHRGGPFLVALWKRRCGSPGEREKSTQGLAENEGGVPIEVDEALLCKAFWESWA